MAEPAHRTMTVDEFFAWQLHQDELYELVDGVPVPRHRMMTGTSVQHDQVTVNVIATLHGQLQGTPCRPTTADVAIRTTIKDIRRPDIMVECAELVRDTYDAREPRLVVEVMSPSMSFIDKTRKLDEYKRHPTLQYILLIETREPQALLYLRIGDAWETQAFEGLDAIIDMPAIRAKLILKDVYAGLSFDAHRSIIQKS